jgi:hypothetical protein
LRVGIRHVVGVFLLLACHRGGSADAGKPPDPNLTAADLAEVGLRVDVGQGNAHVERPEGGRVEVDYQYHVDSIALASSLNIEVDAQKAQVFYDDTLSGQQLILGRQGLTMRPCAKSHDLEKLVAWGGQADCMDVLKKDGAVVGFFLLAKHAPRVYLMMAFAPGIDAVEPKLLERVVGRLDALAVYQP